MREAHESLAALGPAAPLVAIDALSVVFRNQSRAPGAPALFRAVDQVSLAIFPREVLGLVGESGSGKTTFGKALLRLYEPSGGSIRFRGTDITHLSERQLKRHRHDLQMVFQDPIASFNPRHTIGHALGLPLRIHRLCSRLTLSAEVGRLLRSVGLSPALAERFPHELSGGQLQRAAIGRALALRPALIVADEAVSKLDVSVRAQILNLFKDTQESLGLTLLFITHDLHVARYLCHRIAVMYFGRLVEVAPTAALFAAPRHPYTAALLGTLDEDPRSGSEPAMPRVAASSDPRQAKGCRYYARCPVHLPRCATAEPALEPVDAAHTVACYYESGNSSPAASAARS